MSKAPVSLVGVVPQIGQRPRIAGRPRRLRDAERRQRLGRDDPGRHGRAEILAEKRPERLQFPLLDVARRPVVDEPEAEHVVAGLGDRDRLAERVAGSDPHREFELVIELAPARSSAHPRWRLCAGRSAGGSAHPTAAPTTPGCDRRPARICNSG